MEKTFEEKMKRLEVIVATLEESNSSLEQTFELFLEGQKLIKELGLTLNEFDKKINDLLGEDK